MYRYLARRSSPEVAEELASETFIQAFEARARYRPDFDTARPWLFGIATNLLRHHFRSQTRGAAALDKYVARVGDAESGVDSDMHALLLATAQELERILEDDREALLLFAWADLSLKEIASITRTPVGTVKSRIHRAREHLREPSRELRE